MYTYIPSLLNVPLTPPSHPSILFCPVSFLFSILFMVLLRDSTQNLLTQILDQIGGFPSDSLVMNLPMQERQQCLGWEDPLEKEISTHSRTLAWEIP